MNKFKKEIYQRLDVLEKENKELLKNNKILQEAVQEVKSGNKTFEIGKILDKLRQFIKDSYTFTIEYINSLYFLNNFKISNIDSIKLRKEMLDKKIGDLPACKYKEPIYNDELVHLINVLNLEKLEDVDSPDDTNYPKLASISSDYIIQIVDKTICVSDVLSKILNFDPITIIRVAEYVQEVLDLDYKVSKYAEFEEYEEE